MELLQEIEDRGYPSDYLFSRIRGKRSHLIAEWEYIVSLPDPFDYCVSVLRRPTVADNDHIWQDLLEEFRWVYRGMNRDMRSIFRSFFAYAELRTIFVSLRYIKGGRRGKIGKVLSLSLLSERVRRILLSAGDIVAAVEATASQILTSLTERPESLAGIFPEQGLRGVEQFVTDRYLEYAAESAPHPVLQDFFGHLIDARNVLSLYKYARLNAKNPPPFIRGGSIGEKTFFSVRESREPGAISPLVRTVTGMTIGVPGVTEVENALYRNITGRLRKAGRDTLGAGLILDYLWRCSLEARNLSTLFYARDLDRESLSGELIL